MPKQKTNSAAKKRFSVKKSGAIKRSQQGRRHILSKKKTSVKRALRKSSYVDKTQAKTIKQMVQG
jgi:large subunit ribosomal protein L35